MRTYYLYKFHFYGALHIGPDDIAIERRFKRESPILTPPPGFQPKQKTTVKKRHRGEER